MGIDGVEAKEDSLTRRMDYGGLNHASEDLIKQTELCSKFFNVMHKQGLKTGSHMLGKRHHTQNIYQPLVLHCFKFWREGVTFLDKNGNNIE